MFAVLHTFQLDFHCKCITVNMFLVFTNSSTIGLNHRCKVFPWTKDTFSHSIGAVEVCLRLAGSFLTLSWTRSDADKWEVRWEEPSLRLGEFPQRSCPLRRWIALSVVTSASPGKKATFSPTRFVKRREKKWRTKTRYPLGSFLRPLGWQLWQNNQRPHYFICKQW